MNKILKWVGLGSIIVASFLGVMWCIWSLYTWVMPQLWPNGPQNLINPGYWLFFGAWILLGIIGRRVFGRNKVQE